MRYSRPFIISASVFAAYMAAFNIYSFALPLLAYDLRGTGVDLSLIKGAAFIPNILFAIFVGVVNDRIRKALGMRVYAGVIAILSGGLFVLVSSGQVSVPLLIVFMILFNTVGYALGNMVLTVVRLSVPQERLSNATALTSGIGAVISTAAPAIGGFALMMLGHEGLIAGLSLMLVLAFLAAFSLRLPEEPARPQRFWPALVEGFAVFRANRELVMMTVVIVLTNAAEGAFGVGLILKLKAQLLANDFEIGVVLAWAGLGAVIGSAYAPRLRQKWGYRAAFFWPIWVLGLLYLAAGASGDFVLLCVISFCEGAVSIFFAIGIWSYRQESVAAAHMGRVAGITGAIFKIAMPVLIVLAGWIADQAALVWVFALAAGVNLAAALFLVRVAGWGWPRPAA